MRPALCCPNRWQFVFLCLFLAWSPASGETGTALWRQDVQRLLSPGNLGLAALAIGAAGLAHQWDDELSGEVWDHPVMQGVLDLADVYGSTRYGVPATFGVWVLARVAHCPALQAVSLEMLRALVLTNAVVFPIKLAVGRERPDHSNRLSFPSGHAANAFALSAVLHRRYGWRVGIPLYGFTAMVPVARIHGRRHFFSDVVGGAILGTIVGYAVTRQGEGADRRITWMPVRTSSGWLLRVQGRL